MLLRFVGTISGTRGIKGDLILIKSIDNIAGIKPNSRVKVGFSENFSKDNILKTWENNNKGAVIKIDGINSKEAATALKEQGIYANDSDIIFVDLDYYTDDDLYGCEVHDNKLGNMIGTVKEIWHLPANDVWLVETANGNLPVPFIDDVVKTIDINKKIIEIYLIDGLIELLPDIRKKKQ